MALVLLTYSKDRVWDVVNNAIANNRNHWNDFLELVKEALQKLPSQKCRAFIAIQNHPNYSKNGYNITLPQYLLLSHSDKNIQRTTDCIVLEFNLLRGYSMSGYAYSKEFEQSIVAMPGKYKIISPLVPRKSNLYYVELSQQNE